LLSYFSSDNILAFLYQQRKAELGAWDRLLALGNGYLPSDKRSVNLTDRLSSYVRKPLSVLLDEYSFVSQALRNKELGLDLSFEDYDPTESKTFASMAMAIEKSYNTNLQWHRLVNRENLPVVVTKC
jgi:hypothetical protein